MKKFDLDYVKKHWEQAQKGELVQTRKGAPVKLFSIDCRGNYPIAGIVVCTHSDVVSAWNTEGVCWSSDKDEYLVINPNLRK